MLAPSSAPLSPDQTKQLTDILTKNRFEPGLVDGAATNSMAGVRIDDSLYYGAQRSANRERDWYAPVTDAVVTEAARFLNPVQIAALKQYQLLQASDLQLTAPAKPPTHQ